MRLSSCGALGFQDWWQLMSTRFVTFASEYHHFLLLAAWTTWLSGRMKSQHCTLQMQDVYCWCSMHTTMYVHTSFYTCPLWKRIELFNEYFLIVCWMMLLLLLVINNTTILLMVLLNTINRNNRWLLYTATLLSLLLAINNRPTQLVIMAWHCWGDLASWVFSDTCGRKNHWMVLSQCWPTSALLQHLLRSSSTVVVSRLTQNMQWRKPCTGEPPHYLCVRCFQGTQVTVSHCPVINKVDCCGEFYLFTNQAFVLWCLGTCQEWWRLLAQSTHFAWCCADTMFS